MVITYYLLCQAVKVTQEYQCYIFFWPRILPVNDDYCKVRTYVILFLEMLTSQRQQLLNVKRKLSLLFVNDFLFLLLRLSKLLMLPFNSLTFSLIETFKNTRILAFIVTVVLKILFLHGVKSSERKKQDYFYQKRHNSD